MPFFDGNLVVDWQTPLPAIVTNTYVGMGVKGLYFDRRIGEEEPIVTIPDLPDHLSSHTEKF